jgi:energy-converting hydrogenase Eha subunit C
VTWWIVWIKRMWRWQWWWNAVSKQGMLCVFAACRWRDGSCELNGCDDENGDEMQCPSPSREYCVCLLRAGDVMDRVNQTDVTMKMVMKCSVQAGNVVCVCCVQVTWWIVWIKRMWRWNWWRWKSRVSKQGMLCVFAACRWCDGSCELNGCDDENGEDENAVSKQGMLCVFAACRWRDGSCEVCRVSSSKLLCLQHAGDVINHGKHVFWGKPGMHYHQVTHTHTHTYTHTHTCIPTKVHCCTTENHQIWKALSELASVRRLLVRSFPVIVCGKSPIWTKVGGGLCVRSCGLRCKY